MNLKDGAVRPVGLPGEDPVVPAAPPAMTAALDAIRARHVSVADGPVEYCDYDDKPWPCDAAILRDHADMLDSDLGQAADRVLHLTRENARLVKKASRADKGALEYDEQNHALIFTERLSPDEYGASALVGHGVPPWMGNALIEALAALDRAEAVVVAARALWDGIPATAWVPSRYGFAGHLDDLGLALRAYEDADKVADG